MDIEQIWNQKRNVHPDIVVFIGIKYKKKNNFVQWNAGYDFEDNMVLLIKFVKMNSTGKCENRKKKTFLFFNSRQILPKEENNAHNSNKLLLTFLRLGEKLGSICGNSVSRIKRALV